MSSAAVTHLAEGLCLKALLTAELESSLVGTRIPRVGLNGVEIYFALESINKK